MNNVSKGKDFEEVVFNKLKELYKCNFNRYSKTNRNLVTFSIGNPPKSHRFDIVSEDKSIVVECKDNNWPRNGQTPRGKIAAINEAVLYF